MKTFQIEIMETLAVVKNIEAETLEQAIAIAKEQYMNEEIALDANHFIDVEFSSMYQSDIGYTTDTLRPLTPGEELYHNEESGDYYDSWLAMVRDVWYKGMPKEELAEALDIDSRYGYLYYTSYEGKC